MGGGGDGGEEFLARPLAEPLGPHRTLGHCPVAAGTSPCPSSSQPQEKLRRCPRLPGQLHLEATWCGAEGHSPPGDTWMGGSFSVLLSQHLSELPGVVGAGRHPQISGERD